MIAYLRGTVHAHRDDGIIVCVSDIGYRVAVPSRVRDALAVGAEIELYTYHHVREDALELFGFTDDGDRVLFERIISVSGIGPKLGLALLSAYTASQLRSAIMNSDVALLSSVSGVGKKTAERIVLDIKETIADLPTGDTGDSAQAHGADINAVEALIALGYSQQEAVQALQGVDSQLSVEDQIRAALKG